MKKTIAILLAVCLCIGLCACRQTSDESGAESSTITLNAENISEYLGVKIGELTRYGNWLYKTTVEFYPLQPGDFSNVTIEFKVDGDFSFVDSVFGSDGWNEKNRSIIPVSLPADGRYSIEIVIFDDVGLQSVDELVAQAVTGTFIPR